MVLRPQSLMPRTRSVTACTLLLAGLAAGCSTGPATSDPAGTEQSALDKAEQVLHMAESIQQAGDAASAALFYRRAITLEPDNSKALIGLAETEASMGARDDAARAYEKVLALRPDDTAARIAFGKLLLASDQPDKALSQFQEVVRRVAKDPRGYTGVGVALDLLGRHEEAQAAYTDGLLREPHSAAIRNNLALSLALAGDYDAAIRLLEEVGRDPAMAGRANDNRALVLALAGNLDAALAAGGEAPNASERAARRDYLERLTRLTGNERAAVVFGVRDVPKMSAAARPMADQPASPASAVGTTPRDTPSILPIAAAAGAATIDPANGASSRAAPKTNVRDGATEKTADGQPSQLAANDPPPQPAAKADVTRPPRQTTPALATPVAISVATAAAVMATLPGAGADHGPTASAMATLPGMTP